LGFFAVKAIQLAISANVSIHRIEVKIKLSLFIGSQLHVYSILFFSKEYLLKKEIKKVNDFLETDEPYIKLENVTASWSSSKLKVG